jgi:CubicO group peptidase (beta-lactamase class C family)
MTDVDAHPVAAELREVLAAAVAEHHVPGSAAALLVDGQVHVAAVGVTNVDHPAPVEPATLFQVGSVTKTLCSAAVALLVEEGSVAFADPVARHLPDLGPATGLDLEAVTVEHLLSHTSGIDGDWLFTTGGTEVADLAGAPSLFPPGTAFSYSNAGFSLAGAIVEAVTGRSFPDVVTDRLLRPLGCGAACFTADAAITRSVAAPHWVFDGTAYVIRGAGWQPGWELGAVDLAAGGLVASVEDLARWGRAQLDGLAADGSVLLSDESRARLHRPVVRADARTEIALDWFVAGSTLGHGGLTAGYATDLVVAPDAEVVVAVATHATNGASVNQVVRRALLARHAGIVERDPEPQPSAELDLTSVVGTYRHSLGEVDVALGTEPGTVVATSRARDDRVWQPPPDPPLTLAPAGPDHLVSLDAAGPVQLVRLGEPVDGEVPWLLWGLRRVGRVGPLATGGRPGR